MGKWIKRFVLEKWFSHSEDLGMNIIGSTVRLIWHRSTAAHQVNKIFLFFLGRCIPCSTSDKHDTPFSACTTSPFLLISTHRHAPVYHLSLSGQRCDFFFCLTMNTLSTHNDGRGRQAVLALVWKYLQLGATRGKELFFWKAVLLYVAM